MQAFFPTIVYRCPGAHSRPGGSYDWLSIASEEALEDAFAKGWFASMPEAIEGKRAESVDDSAPTREELELKAIELEIPFDGRTSDKKLAKLIADALEPGNG